MAGGYVNKPSPGWYARTNEENKVRHEATLVEDFWKPIFENTDFKEYIKGAYQIGGNRSIDLEDARE